MTTTKKRLKRQIKFNRSEMCLLDMLPATNEKKYRITSLRKKSIQLNERIKELNNFQIRKVNKLSMDCSELAIQSYLLKKSERLFNR